MSRLIDSKWSQMPRGKGLKKNIRARWGQPEWLPGEC